MTEKPGLKPGSRSTQTELECWKLFINDVILGSIVKYTNGNDEIMSYQTQHASIGRFKNTTYEVEIYASIGLLYFAGLCRCN